MATPWLRSPAGAAEPVDGSGRPDRRCRRNVALWCIVDAARLDELLQVVFAIVARQVGLVSVSDVQVVRPERF